MNDKPFKKEATNMETNTNDKPFKKEATNMENNTNDKPFKKEATNMENKPIKEATNIEKKKKIQIDYKSPATLYQFISEGGKISPVRITGLKHAEQRQLRSAVKKARRLSLIPSSSRAYDDFGWPEQISPVPFELD